MDFNEILAIVQEFLKAVATVFNKLNLGKFFGNLLKKDDKSTPTDN